jgi:preprotein translocase subunit YajC
LYVVLCIGVFSITHSIWQASQQRTQEHEELLEELRALRGPEDDDDE